MKPLWLCDRLFSGALASFSMKDHQSMKHAVCYYLYLEYRNKKSLPYCSLLTASGKLIISCFVWEQFQLVTFDFRMNTGTLLFMCLCCAAYYLFRGKKGFEVDISTKSSDNLTVHKEQKAWGAYKHANNFPTSPEQPRTARASSGRDNRNEPSELVAIKRVPSVNPNLNPNTNSNSTVEYTVSSTDAGAVDWQSEVNRMPVLKDRPTIGVRKLSDDHPLRKALRTSFSGSSAVQSNVRVPHSDRSVGHEFVPRIDTAPRFPTDRSFDIEHAWCDPPAPSQTVVKNVHTLLTSTSENNVLS